MQTNGEAASDESGKESTVRRKRTCIICGEKATSAEHVFPSALGGRRKNKGIYCHSHNNWLGSYVAVLQDQISLINAQLEVQPDRGNAKPFVIVDKQGRRFELFGTHIRLAPDLDKILDDAADGSPQHVQMDPAFLKALHDRAKERGLTLSIDETSSGVEWQTGPLSTELMFGGPSAMRAVSYLAITFVAHFWPEVARGEGLARIKSMIMSGDIYKGNDHVANAEPVTNFTNWASIEESSEVPEPHSVVGHTVVICATNGRLVSYVSLFGVLRFKILLGECELMEKSVITHIDPLQTGFGIDWKVDHVNYAVLSYDTDPISLADDVLDSRRMQLVMCDVLERIWRVQNSREYGRARNELEDMTFLDPQARVAASRSFVQKQRQRILNLVRQLASEETDDLAGIIVKRIAQEIIEDEPKTESGLSLASLLVLDALSEEFASEIHARSEGKSLSEEEFVHVFMGGQGLYIVARFLTAPLMRSPGFNMGVGRG